MTEARRETYERLVALGKTPCEAWELIAQMDFAEDYEEPGTYHQDMGRTVRLSKGTSEA